MVTFVFVELSLSSYIGSEFKSDKKETNFVDYLRFCLKANIQKGK